MSDMESKSVEVVVIERLKLGDGLEFILKYDGDGAYYASLTGPEGAVSEAPPITGTPESVALRSAKTWASSTIMFAMMVGGKLSTESIQSVRMLCFHASSPEGR